MNRNRKRRLEQTTQLIRNAPTKEDTKRTV
jgi:hypothetical protein